MTVCLHDCLTCRYGLSDDCEWHTLVDAAAFVPMKYLDASLYPADFIAISFYKMMGYPSGLGALVLNNESSHTLKKKYFGGGSVVAAACESRWCKQKADTTHRFEDGTVSFLSIVSLKYGLQYLRDLGFSTIEMHVAALTRYLARELDALRHESTGTNVILRYGHSHYIETDGGIINFNVLRPDGTFVSFSQVEHDASSARIHLRTGCFCNPGACQDFLGLTDKEIRESSEERLSCSDPRGMRDDKPLGSIRVSFGYLSTWSDADAVVNFMKARYQN
eukprot:GHVU01167023.1.p1 GENE.GHVU01167023.1~~GHVU01167023.1.p1  ORF type:complete len:277 (+),score=52.50 GHVU01167023.1:25-855(+)